MEKFTSSTFPLAELLQDAEKGKLQLPDFQRGWVWDERHIRSLLASISLSYPVGAVMTLAAGNPDVHFKARLLEGVVLADPPDPSMYLMDGQQRLTSLYYALKSGEPVHTRDNSGKSVRRHYYANIRKCIDPEADREEEGIVAIPEDKVVRSDFGRKIDLDLSTREQEIAEEMFPLDIIFDSEATFDWQMEYVQSNSHPEKNRFNQWKRFANEIIKPFSSYRVPKIELAMSTRKEAVCAVFEKVNTGGVTLTVFELLTATYAAEGFALRRDWDERKGRLARHELLAKIDPPLFLQIVTLLATYDRRQSHLQARPEEDRPPAVSCKRRDILRLSLDDYREWADRAEDGLLRAVPFLHGLRIFRQWDLPYATQLAPLGAILGWTQADTQASRERLGQWFWCGVLGEMYSGATETRFANDLEDCVKWIGSRGEADAPRTVETAQFQAERLLSLRTRNSAAYKGVYALSMKRDARDFRTGQAISVYRYAEDAIDIHHIFPQSWCQKNGIERGIADCIVNKTALSAETNRRLGGAAPSVYISRIKKADELGANGLDDFLFSHYIAPAALHRDDFAQFFNHRFEDLLKLVANAMGKPVNRSPDRDESPFAEQGASVEKAVQSLIDSGESEFVEFKSSARHNFHTGTRDDAMTWAVLKTIAAFMNTHGGTLLIGVDDAGKPVGIETDYPHVKRRNRDGWGLWLTEVVMERLGTLAASDVDITYCVMAERTVARIDVPASPAPVFAKRKGEPGQGFFVRYNNLTKELAGPDFLAYEAKHWPR